MNKDVIHPKLDSLAEIQSQGADKSGLWGPKNDIFQCNFEFIHLLLWLFFFFFPLQLLQNPLNPAKKFRTFG